MREILIKDAHRHRALRRGGGCKEQLDESSAVVKPKLDLLALNEALEKVAAPDPRKPDHRAAILRPI